ncbi:hypothetical protein [Clostridium sp. AF32-12BH]|uniref:hypothetical protein n=1 Tax=Clostridium sp. AF32-12BH TaxID=2292006 RepID=UPI0011C2283C|nr:hypothetical protein [Clostridium sp. AF32-12BH]
MDKTTITNNGLNHIRVVKLDETSSGTLSFQVPDCGGQTATGYLMYDTISCWFSYISNQNKITGLSNATIKDNVVTLTGLKNYIHGAAIIALRFS